jgi:hypothetical protein
VSVENPRCWDNLLRSIHGSGLVTVAVVDVSMSRIVCVCGGQCSFTGPMTTGR